MKRSTQLYIEKIPIMICIYIGKHFHLLVGKEEHFVPNNRAYTVCSNEALLKKELQHIENVFKNKNGYPTWVIKQILKEVKENRTHTPLNQIETTGPATTPTVEKTHSLMLPYAGTKGNTIIKSMNSCLKRNLPNNVNTRVTYTGQKLNTKFQIKDKTDPKHVHDLIYYAKCPEEFCNDDYLGETDRRIFERTIDHNGRDKKSHLLKHALGQDHPHVDLDHMTVIDSGYHSNKLK